MSGYVSLGPVMYNTLHSIAPASGSISSRPDSVPGGGRSTVDASQVLALMLVEDLFSRLSGIYHLKSCQKPLHADVTDIGAVSMAASELVKCMTVTLASRGRESSSDNTHIQLSNRLATVNMQLLQC